jgi:hypothetical protein
MTHFLVSDSNPGGYRLEDILRVIRKDIILRCTKVLDDNRAEAQHVVDNNMRILTLLSDAINLAEDSTQTLNRAFGPSKSSAGGKPRIGSS